MVKFKVKDNTVYNCPTEDINNKFIKILDKSNYKWCTGVSYINHYLWPKHGSSTCYDVVKGQYNHLDTYTKGFLKNIVIVTESFLKRYETNINYILW